MPYFEVFNVRREQDHEGENLGLWRYFTVNSECPHSRNEIFIKSC